MKFSFGDVTLGYGVTDKTFEMLNSIEETNEFKEWLEKSGKEQPNTSPCTSGGGSSKTKRSNARRRRQKKRRRLEATAEANALGTVNNADIKDV